MLYVGTRDRSAHLTAVACVEASGVNRRSGHSSGRINYQSPPTSLLRVRASSESINSENLEIPKTMVFVCTELYIELNIDNITQFYAGFSWLCGNPQSYFIVYKHVRKYFCLVMSFWRFKLEISKSIIIFSEDSEQ